MSIIDFPQDGEIGLSLRPKRFDFEVYHGDTFQFDLVLKSGTGAALDLTEWKIKAQIKKVSDNTPAETPMLETTIADATTGKIVVRLSDTGSAALGVNTEYKYDIQATDSANNVRTFLGGKISVTEDVTE